MAIAWTELTQGSETLAGTPDTATTASITPTANVQVFVAFAVAQEPGGVPADMTGSVSGCNLTWSAVTGQDYGLRRKLFVWRGVGASPTTEALTLSLTSSAGGFALQEALWSVDEASNVDSDTPTDAAVTNAATTVTSLALPDVGTPGADDHIYAAFGLEQDKTASLVVDDGTLLTSLGGGANVRHLVAFYDADHSDETPSISWTTACHAGGIGFIVNAVAGAPPEPGAIVFNMQIG